MTITTDTRKPVCLRIPNDTLQRFDKLSRLSGSNRTSSIVQLMNIFIAQQLRRLKETKSLKALLDQSPDFPLKAEPEDDLPDFPEPDGWGRWR
jgi:hypothetical protein